MARAVFRLNNPCSAKKAFGETICFLSLLESEPSTCAGSRRSVRSSAKASDRLPLAEPTALARGWVPMVCSCDIHLPGPLGSTGISRFHSYYGTSDSCGAGSSPSCSPQVSLFHGSSLPAIPSPTTLRRPPILVWFRIAGLPPRSRDERRTHWAGFRTASLGLRLFTAGSPRRQAESSSSSYGLAIHLPLLPTSPHGDAVTFGYKVQTQL